MTAPSPRPSTSPWRAPFAVRLMALVFLALSVEGWLRLWQALRLWRILAEIGLYPGPLYLALSGALWGLAGLGALWALLFRRRQARPWVALAALLFPLTYWIDRLFVAQPEAGFPNWPFVAGVTVLWLAYSAFVLLRILKR